MKTINEQCGLTEIYQHDIDEKTHKCKKCNKDISELLGGLKICSVIGTEEVAKFRDYDER